MESPCHCRGLRTHPGIKVIRLLENGVHEHVEVVASNRDAKHGGLVDQRQAADLSREPQISEGCHVVTGNRVPRPPRQILNGPPLKGANLARNWGELHEV